MVFTLMQYPPFVYCCVAIEVHKYIFGGQRSINSLVSIVELVNMTVASLDIVLIEMYMQMYIL